ncbi:unnamed protein product [Symbiodinium sp. CCMP2456]|nr:unnamed protein product [Symbiodinium sp. CCMP2456]
MQNEKSRKLQETSILQSYSRAISCHGRRQLWRTALEAFWQLQTMQLRIDTVAHGAIVNACGRSAAWHHGWHLLSGARFHSLQENTIVFNGAITAVGKTWRQSLRLLTCIGCKNVQVDIVTISTMVSSCGAGHHWLQGLILFQALRKLAVEGDIVAGNAVLNTLDQSMRWQQCAHSFAQLRGTALQPSAISLNSLISASSTEGRWQYAACCFTQAHSLTLQQDAFSQSSLVRACELAEEWQVALWCVGCSSSLSLVLCNAAVSTCEKSSRWEVAARLLKQFRHTRQRPDSVTHNAELCSYGRGSKWQQAFSALWGLKSMTTQANAIGHNTALFASVEAKQWRSAIRILEALPRSCLQADEVSLNTGLSAMEGGQNWKQTLDLFTSDFSARLQRDIITFNSVINVCAAGGAWSKAAQLLTDAVQTELEINLITYNGALRSYSQASRWRASLQCLGNLRPISPDMVSLEAVINSCEACRELEMQGALLHRLENTAILRVSAFAAELQERERAADACPDDDILGFRFHKGAARCVDARAGSWSESERALNSDKAALGYATQSAYPNSLILEIAGGVDAVNIAGLGEQTGVRYLKLNAGAIGFHAKRAGTGSESRVHFSGKATRSQLDQLRIQVENLLAQAHQTMARKLENLRPVELIVTGLPAKMLPADVEDLVASFGTVESVEPLQPGQMVVTFDSPAAAEKAAGGLRGECLGEQSLECHLKPRPPLDEEDVAADAAEVLVMNIHPEATAEEIEALFSPIGPAKVRWPSSNQDAGSLRFCYVRFASLTQAQNAVTQLVGVTLHGQGVQVSPAKPMSNSCTLFVGKIPYEAEESHVQEALSPAGEVAGVRILRNGQKGSIAFADFTCAEDAAKALDTLQGVYCLGSRLHLELEEEKKQQWLLARAPRPRGSQRSQRAQNRTKWDPSPSKLFLGNVPAEATEEDLRSIFCAVEGLIEVAIVRSKTDDTGPGYAFVRYMTAEQATMALDKFQVLELFGRQLRLRPSGKENDDWRNSRKAPPGRTLIIRHLPRSAQESELRVLFEPYGKITQVKVLHEKDFTHAQVVYKEAAHAKAAQECLQKVDFRGRSVKVVRAKSRSPQRKDQQQQQKTSVRPHLFVGNLPAELDENTFRETMEGGGEVSHVKLLREKSGKFKCCAFVEYADPACVDEAIELLNNVNCLDKPMKVQRYRSPTPPGRTSSAPFRRPHVFVGNLPAELDENTFRETMEGGGEVSHVKLLREKNGKFKGCAFVEYADPASVDEAIELLNNVNCLDKPMKVQRYRSPTPPGRTRTRSRSRSPRVPYPAADPGVWRPPAVVPHYLQPSAGPPMMSFLPPPRPTSAVAPSTPRSIVRPSCAAHLREGSDNDQADRSRSRGRLPPPRRRTAGHETQRW